MNPLGSHNFSRRFQREGKFLRPVLFVFALGVCPPPGETLSQSSSHFEDRHAQLWIGTAGNLLVRFDPLTERFLKYRLEEVAPGKTSDPKEGDLAAVKSIAEDAGGALWLITRDHQPYRCRFDHVQGIAWLEKVYMGDRCEVLSLCFEAPDVAWVANSCGLQRLAFLRPRHDLTQTPVETLDAEQGIEVDHATPFGKDREVHAPPP